MTEVFDTAGKEAGLQVWRVESMKLVENSQGANGNFHTGDAYLILRTRQMKGGSFRWDLHFWLGLDSSQDERGAAAILTTQMDEHLGGGPVQYRQIEGYESLSFMELFPKGVKYLKGGVASGFKKTETNVSLSKRLLHVKGRRSVRATEVPMKWSSFNHGDCFILDYGNKVFQWNGKDCNGFEKLKANNVAKALISDEKGGKGELIKIDDGEPLPRDMSSCLEGSPSDIQPATSDDVKEQLKPVPATLHHVSSDSGTLKVTKVGEAPFSQSDLVTGDCFILDNGSYGKISIWKGSKASKDERNGAIRNATQFIEDNKYNKFTQIEIMAEKAETVSFKQFFKDWRNKDETVGFGEKFSASKIAKIEQLKFDMKSLSDSKLAAKHRMVDDGSGKLEIWRVEGDLQPVDAKNYGIFFAGDCYVMLYTYQYGRKEAYIIYYWQGLHATKDEITASAYHAVAIDDKYGGAPVQVRVVQGKEPPHLLSLFGGKPMVIVSGGRSKGKNDAGIDETALIQIFCTANGGRAIQVATSARSLNSNDTFILKTKSQCYIWVGVGASEEEVNAAKHVAGRLSSHTPKILKEKQEDDSFWSILGGKQEYASHPRLQDDVNENPPRLFAISNASGRVIVDEVPGEFSQSDLCEDDVMMLDVWDQVFIWIGKGANEKERKAAPELAQDYIRLDPTGRRNTPYTTVKQGSEPGMFTGFFPAWNA